MYRIGGDEFVVVMPDADRDKIQDFMRRFGDMFNREASMPEFTFSWGYSIYDPKADADLYSTCRRADKNMYMRKQQYYKNKTHRRIQMGLLDKLFKKGPKADEVSKGGSPIYRYEDKENEGWRPPEAYGVYAEEINAHFQGLFPTGRNLCSMSFYRIWSTLM